MRSPPPTLLIATPYLAQANNGNWRTASRWARLASPPWRCIVQRSDEPVTGGRRDDAALLVALHARRSRAAIEAWRSLPARRPLVVALTGTDLYRDLPGGNPAVRASLDDADRIVVLQADALAQLTPAWRAKAHVVHQSARSLVPFPRKSAQALHVALVAHLRDEKDPRTVFDAWRRLPADLPATLTIIGAALDPLLGESAAALAREDARVQWLGPRAHAWTRQAIKRAHLLVVPSRMEGGANVVVEALTAGTAVLGSRMSGNVGMLGDDYDGYFPVGDAAALAESLAALVADRRRLAHLEAQCRARAALFTPQAERSALLAALGAAMASPATGR